MSDAHGQWRPEGPAGGTPPPPLQWSPAPPTWVPEPPTIRRVLPDPQWQPPAPAPARRSRRSLWWTLGALLLAAAVAAGVFVVLTTRGLAEPGGLTATPEDGGVRLTWEAVDGALRYEVYRGERLITETESTEYLDEQAPPASEQTYAVRAVGDDDERSARAVADPVTTPLGRLVGLEATLQGADVLLTWAALEGAESYEVRRDDELLAEGLTEPRYTDQVPPLGEHGYEVTAVDEDGGAGSSSSVAAIQTPGPWLDDWRIAAAFPDLVPEEPGGTAPDGAVCTSGVPQGAARLVVCDRPDGLHLEIAQFADGAQQDAAVERVRDVAEPGNRTWLSASGDEEGGLFLSRPDSPAPWLFLTFWDGGYELFAVQATWPGHTLEELQTRWLAQAPLRDQ
ncbi:fibronectin type III domain-containing protein [Blastococcus sp. SYSU D00820]